MPAGDGLRGVPQYPGFSHTFNTLPMKSLHRSTPRSESAVVCRRGLAFLCLVVVAPVLLLAAPPAWWGQRGVLDPAQESDDFAAVNAGQLKNLAKQAMEELDARLPGGAGAAVHDLVASFSAVSAERDDFAAVNVGHAKAVAKPFYDRLIAAGFATGYPWANESSERNDFAALNTGQLKNLFSFDPSRDVDQDGLPDMWENARFGSVAAFAGSDDADGDRLSNFWEWAFQTDPNLRDTDSDGLDDGQETVVFASLGLSATIAHSKSAVLEDDEWLAVQDGDGDGLPTRWELANNLDPSDPADAGVDHDGDGLTAAQEFGIEGDPWNADTDFDGRMDSIDGPSGAYANDPTNGQYQWRSSNASESSSNLQGAALVLEFTLTARTITFNGILGHVSSAVYLGNEPIAVTSDAYEHPIPNPFWTALVSTVDTPFIYQRNEFDSHPDHQWWVIDSEFAIELQVRLNADDGQPEWSAGAAYNPNHPDASPTEPADPPLLLPVELYSDLNNDGQLTSADAGLVGKPYASGASEDEKDKGTEFIFLNDDLSNGAWDRNDSKTPSDGKPADPNDDDAEEIVIKLQASQGEIWLEHPAIDSIKFYDNAKCTGTEVPLKSGNRLNLATRTIPEHVYMRVDTEVNGHQSAGDLVLKYASTAGGTAIDATKMRLVVVDDIRAEKHHRAVADYIREKNSKHFVAWIDSTKESVYVGYLGKETLVDGVDPRHRFETVHDAFSLDADAIVNGNYAGDHTGTTGCAGWPDWQDGEIYESGTWNTATSHLAGPARQGYWRTAIDWNTAKFVHTNGNGTVPAASTRGGIGGLAVPQVDGDKWASAMGRAELQGGDQLIYVADVRRNVDLTAFREGMSAGSISAFFGQLDGGGSNCLAVGSPSGQLFLPISPSVRHHAVGKLYYKGRNDLVGGYLRLQTTRGRVEP